MSGNRLDPFNLDSAIVNVQRLLFRWSLVKAALDMVLKPMKFTPEVLIGAPR